MTSNQVVPPKASEDIYIEAIDFTSNRSETIQELKVLPFEGDRKEIQLENLSLTNKIENHMSHIEMIQKLLLICR